MSIDGSNPEIQHILPPTLPDKFNHNKVAHISPRKDAFITQLREDKMSRHPSVLPNVTIYDAIRLLAEEKKDVDALKDEEEKFIKTEADSNLLYLLEAKKYFATQSGEQVTIGGRTFKRDEISEQEAELNPYFRQQRHIEKLLNYAINLVAPDETTSAQSSEKQKQDLITYFEINYKRWMQGVTTEALSVIDDDAVAHAKQNALLFTAFGRLIRQPIPSMIHEETFAQQN